MESDWPRRNKSHYITEIVSWLGFADVIFGGDKRQPEIRLRSQARINWTVSKISCVRVGTWYETLFPRRSSRRWTRELGRNNCFRLVTWAFQILSRVFSSAREMAVRRVEWALLILVILKIAFSSSEETCKKISVCSCELSNGQKIDLKPADGTASSPR